MRCAVNLCAFVLCLLASVLCLLSTMPAIRRYVYNNGNIETYKRVHNGKSKHPRYRWKKIRTVDRWGGWADDDDYSYGWIDISREDAPQQGGDTEGGDEGGEDGGEVDASWKEFLEFQDYKRAKAAGGEQAGVNVKEEVEEEDAWEGTVQGADPRATAPSHPPPGVKKRKTENIWGKLHEQNDHPVFERLRKEGTASRFLTPKGKGSSGSGGKPGGKPEALDEWDQSEKVENPDYWNFGDGVCGMCEEPIVRGESIAKPVKKAHQSMDFYDGPRQGRVHSECKDMQVAIAQMRQHPRLRQKCAIQLAECLGVVMGHPFLTTEDAKKMAVE